MITLTMPQLAKHAGHVMESRLRGRELGAVFKMSLRHFIVNTPHDTLLRFSLENVSMMDVSFIDEVFGSVAEERGRGELDGAPLLLVHVDPLDVDDIDRILAGRPGYSTGVRNCVLPLEVSTEIRLLGKTEDYVAQTFLELAKYGQISTSDLAERLNLALNTASTRLKALYDLGIALRQPQEGGRGYTYYMLSKR